MPERTNNQAFAFVVVGLLVCLIGLGFYGAVANRNLDSAVRALKTSSARSECRTSIVNNDEDTFRHRIGALITERDQARRLELGAEILDEERTQSKIDRTCPAPLVSTTTTSTTLPKP